MALPGISVIMPSFNQAAFLEQAIQSVLAQGYPHLQFGIVDGGSTDGSAAIIERYRHRLDFAIVEPDRGQSDALNKGLARARGQVLGWLNSDDTLLPGALLTVGGWFAAHPQSLWLIGRARRIDAAGRNLGPLRPAGLFSAAGALLRDVPFCIPQPATFWRRPLSDRAGLLDVNLHHAMDFDLWVRFFLDGAEPDLLDAELATYREHPGSKTCTQANAFIRALIQIEKRYLPRLNPQQQQTLRRRLGYQRRALATRQPRGELWAQVLYHPWWLLSQQIRQALAA